MNFDPCSYRKVRPTAGRETRSKDIRPEVQRCPTAAPSFRLPRPFIAAGARRLAGVSRGPPWLASAGALNISSWRRERPLGSSAYTSLRSKVMRKGQGLRTEKKSVRFHFNCATTFDSAFENVRIPRVSSSACKETLRPRPSRQAHLSSFLSSVRGLPRRGAARCDGHLGVQIIHPFRVLSRVLRRRKMPLASDAASDAESLVLTESAPHRCKPITDSRWDDALKKLPPDGFPRRSSEDSARRKKSPDFNGRFHRE